MSVPEVAPTDLGDSVAMADKAECAQQLNGELCGRVAPTGE